MIALWMQYSTMLILGWEDPKGRREYEEKGDSEGSSFNWEL